jgi:hypothetical protein
VHEAGQKHPDHYTIPFRWNVGETRPPLLLHHSVVPPSL